MWALSGKGIFCNKLLLHFLLEYKNASFCVCWQFKETGLQEKNESLLDSFLLVEKYGKYLVPLFCVKWLTNEFILPSFVKDQLINIMAGVYSAFKFFLPVCVLRNRAFRLCQWCERIYGMLLYSFISLCFVKKHVTAAHCSNRYINFSLSDFFLQKPILKPLTL